MDSLTVRSAMAGDMTALGRLGALLVAVHHNFDPSRFVAPTANIAARYAAYLETQRTRPDMIVLVAAKGATIFGYAYAGIEGSDAMALRGPAGVLHDLVVDPAYRRHGAGRMLLDAIRTELAARGAPMLVLSTAARNGSAQRLFASAGFRPTMIEMTLDLKTEGADD